MALYVNVRRALKFPVVINAFHSPSRMWRALTKLGASYARRPVAGAGTSRQDNQVDVRGPVTQTVNTTLGIPGISVPLLKRNGHR